MAHTLLRKTFLPSGDFLVWYFRDAFLVPVGVFFVMKAPEDEWWVVIMAYKFAVFEIISIYYTSMLQLHIKSTDSMIITLRDFWYCNIIFIVCLSYTYI